MKIHRSVPVNTIGIIGGADGPTSIFVASRVNPRILTAAALILSAVAACVVLLLLWKKYR